MDIFVSVGYGLLTLCGMRALMAGMAAIRIANAWARFMMLGDCVLCRNVGKLFIVKIVISIAHRR